MEIGMQKINNDGETDLPQSILTKREYPNTRRNTTGKCRVIDSLGQYANVENYRDKQLQINMHTLDAIFLSTSLLL